MAGQAIEIVRGFHQHLHQALFPKHRRSVRAMTVRLIGRRDQMNLRARIGFTSALGRALPGEDPGLGDVESTRPTIYQSSQLTSHNSKAETTLLSEGWRQRVAIR